MHSLFELLSNISVHNYIINIVVVDLSYHKGTITSKINVTPKGAYFPISKLHSILAVANLLAHNNISQFCSCSLQCAAVNSILSENVTLLGVTFILLAMVHDFAIRNFCKLSY